MKKGLLISFLCIIAFLFVSCIKKENMQKVMELFEFFFETSYELEESIPSETGNKTAYIYTSAGGATTGYARRVTISEKTDFDLVDKEQFLLICDSNHGAVKDFKIIVEWIDDNNISVSYVKGTRFFTKKKKFKNVIINYNELAE